MKRVISSFLAAVLAYCSGCFSMQQAPQPEPSSRKDNRLTQEFIGRLISAVPTKDDITFLGDALKRIKNSSRLEDRQLYWAGLRALTVLSGDGWAEAQQALARIHKDPSLNFHALVTESAEDFAQNMERLIHKNDVIDASYVKNVTKRIRTYFDPDPFAEAMARLEYKRTDQGVMLSPLIGGASFPLWFPFREDMAGTYVGFSNGSHPWISNKKKVKRGCGWKIHVPVWPLRAEKVASIVLDCLEKYGTNCKIPETLSKLRWYNYRYRYMQHLSQRGKAITIYPESDEQAAKIVRELDEAFHKAFEQGELVPSDFCPLTGDYQIGSTGGIFARLGSFSNKGENETMMAKERQVPEINPNILREHLKNEKDAHPENIEKLTAERYEHPFKGFSVKLYGENLPPQVSQWPAGDALKMLAEPIILPLSH